MGYVYLLTFPNGKIYVGKTKKSPTKRLYEHWVVGFKRRHRVTYAVRKYGLELIRLEVLHETQDYAKLNALERQEISSRNARDVKIGYNICEGGEGGAATPEAAKRQGKTLSLTVRAKSILGKAEWLSLRERLLRKTERLTDIAKEVGVSPSLLKNLRRGAHWSCDSEEVQVYDGVRTTFIKQRLSASEAARRSRHTFERNVAASGFTLEQFAAIKREMQAGLTITAAMKKFGLKQTMAEHLSSGRHWSCQIQLPGSGTLATTGA